MLRIRKITIPSQVSPPVKKVTEVVEPNQTIRLKTTTKPTHPIVRIWTWIHHQKNYADEIETIQCNYYQWTNMNLPKQTKHHTPKKLCLWFSKIIQKRYGFNDVVFHFNVNYNIYDCILPIIDIDNTPILQKYLCDCIFFPLFEESKDDLIAIDSHGRMPPSLKFEIRSTLESYYPSKE